MLLMPRIDTGLQTISMNFQCNGLETMTSVGNESEVSKCITSLPLASIGSRLRMLQKKMQKLCSILLLL